MKYYYLFFLIIALALSGCIGGAYDECFDNGYCLSALDTKKDMSLVVDIDGYMINVVGPTVYAIGYDEVHIIIKQIKYQKKGMVFDEQNLRYFIIPLKNKLSSEPNKNVLGPLELTEFERQKLELNVSDNIQFRVLM